MEKLKLFFWRCSGAHIDLLKKCLVESTKYAGIGATIFFTGIFAAIAGSFALYTVFDNASTAIAFGLIWGLMIFNLDRYIVSSMRKEGSATAQLKTALPRILLAILISLVIAKPLEMKIFEKEIQAELVIMEQQTRSLQENEIKSRFAAGQERLRTEIGQLKSENLEKTKQRDELVQLAQEEADGTGGTKRRNAGPIYKIKKANADRVNRELEQLVSKNEALIKKDIQKLATTDSAVTSELNALVKQKLDGPAGRIEALNRLTQKSSAIWWTNIFMIFLFIVVETSPVLVKLISPQGPYDHLLKIEEHGFETQRIEAVATINAAAKIRSENLSDTEKGFIKNKLDVTLNS